MSANRRVGHPMVVWTGRAPSTSSPFCIDRRWRSPVCSPPTDYLGVGVVDVRGVAVAGVRADADPGRAPRRPVRPAPSAAHRHLDPGAGATELRLRRTPTWALGSRFFVGVGDATTFVCARLVTSWFSVRRIPLMTQLTGVLGQLGAVALAVPMTWALLNLRTHAYLVTAACGVSAGDLRRSWCDLPQARTTSGRHCRLLVSGSTSSPRPGVIQVLGWDSGCISPPSSAPPSSIAVGFPFFVEGEGQGAGAAGDPADDQKADHRLRPDLRRADHAASLAPVDPGAGHVRHRRHVDDCARSARFFCAVLAADASGHRCAWWSASMIGFDLGRTPPIPSHASAARPGSSTRAASSRACC